MIAHLINHQSSPPKMFQVQQQQQSPSKTQGENGACFRCHKPGHWVKDCPENSANRSPISPPSAATSDPEFPSIHCRCGAGLCEILVSGSFKNPGRKYYRCPAKFGCGYFKWCNELRRQEIREVRPESFPTCGCGAGICSVKIEENGPNAGRSYFACPIKKGDGACNFRQWLDGSPQSALIVPEDTPSEQNSVLDELDLSYEAEMQIDTLQMVASKFHLGEDQVQMEYEGAKAYDGARGTSVGSSEVHPLQVMNNVSENGLDSVLKTQSNDMFQDKMGGSQVENVKASITPVVATLSSPVVQEPGWAGRIVYPLQRVIFSAVSFLFSCSFPKFDQVTMSQDNVSALSSNMDDKPFADLLLDPSVLKDSIDESSIMTGSILQSFEKLACHLQNDLATLLESMVPEDHENMVKEAHCTFVALDRLQVDYGLFHLRVTEYIKQAATLALVGQTINDNASSGELLDRYKSEKSRFEEIFRAFCDARDAFMASNERLSLLRDKIFCVKDVLVELEVELSCCEVENASHRDSLLQIAKNMFECKESLQAASKKAEEALKQSEKREIERCAAKAAYEKAKAQLRN